MRAPIAAALLASLIPGAALAQTYGMQSPAPRTTSVPALREQAVKREIEERFKIGLDAEAAGRWSDAASEFERVVALKPVEPQGSTALYDLSIAYAHLNRNDDAAKALRGAIALDPGFLAAMANLISVDLARGDYDEARDVADRFLAIAPDSARALYSRGIVALERGDPQTARGDFGKLIQLNPQYAVAHYDLALAEERLGHYDEAARELQSALALAPSYARARFALGAVLLHEGRKTQARAAFDQANRDAAGDPALANIAAAMRDSIAI